MSAPAPARGLASAGPALLVALALAGVAAPYVYTYELVQAHPYAERMQRDLIARLEVEPPRFLVFVNVGLSWRPAPGVRNRVVEWYRERVPRSYT